MLPGTVIAVSETVDKP